MSEVFPVIALDHRDQSLPVPHSLSYTLTNMLTVFLHSLSQLLILTAEVLAWATIIIFPPPSIRKMPCSSQLSIPAVICIFSEINTYVYHPKPASLSPGNSVPCSRSWQRATGKGGGRVSGNAWWWASSARLGSFVAAGFAAGFAALLIRA